MTRIRRMCLRVGLPILAVICAAGCDAATVKALALSQTVSLAAQIASALITSAIPVSFTGA